MNVFNNYVYVNKKKKIQNIITVVMAINLKMFRGNKQWTMMIPYT